MLEAHELSAGFDGRPLFRDVYLRLEPGSILGLRGASGAGKTTLGRVLAGLHPAMSGSVRLDGATPPRDGASPVQYLHQNPLAAMNPRWRIRRVLAEAGRPDPTSLATFCIEADWLDRYPHELSGGQLQRISLLRALTARPRFLIADEITAALDPVSQARIWRLLQAVVAHDEIGMLAISHDAGLLARLCGSRIIEL